MFNLKTNKIYHIYFHSLILIFSKKKKSLKSTSLNENKNFFKHQNRHIEKRKNLTKFKVNLNETHYT